VSDDLDLLILLAHGTAAPAFAAHAFHLAAAGAALGHAVGLYLAVDGTAWLADEAPLGTAERLDELRELGVVIYACPASLSERGIAATDGICLPLGATAAARLVRRAGAVMSL
jgi:predicted peroxiredoxin